MTIAPSPLSGPGWQPDPAIVEQTQEKRPSFCFEEAAVAPYILPPLLEPSDALPTPESWMLRRRIIQGHFEEQVFGKLPDRPQSMEFVVLEENKAAMDGRATLQRVQIHCHQAGRQFAFECTIFLPKGGNGPHPVFLLINNRRAALCDPSRKTVTEFWPAEQLIARGYGAAAFAVRQLAPDSPEDFRNGALALLEESESRPGHAGAALAAWGWGAQRVMDYFETRPEIDAARVALAGHSRGGKAALWAGAIDDRFALVIANASGCGGAALSRRRFGETIARLNTQFPHWFCANFRKFNDREQDMPVDQHMLLALMAPRAVYIASADQDLWADPKGEFLSLAHASPAFEIFGHRGILPETMPGLNRPVHGDRQAYHIRPGIHDLTLTDWNHFMNFADKLWPRSPD